MTQATLRSVNKLFHDSSSGLPQELPQFLKSRGIRVESTAHYIHGGWGTDSTYPLSMQDFCTCMMV